MNRPAAKSKRSPLVCFCNGVSREAIEDAIRRGCTTLGKIFDSTTAGCGPCGGSCQPELRKMLAEHLKNDPQR